MTRLTSRPKILFPESNLFLHRIILPVILLAGCSSLNEVKTYKTSKNNTVQISVATKHESQELIGSGYLKSRPEVIVTFSKTFVGTSFIEGKLLVVLTAPPEIKSLKDTLLLKIGSQKYKLKFFSVIPNQAEDGLVFSAATDLKATIIEELGKAKEIKLRIYGDKSPLTYVFNELQVESLQKFSREAPG